MFERFLQEIGLTEKEALIYLALLQVDSASVVDISVKTKIKRPTVYIILQSLERKGLVSETITGRKVRYNAEPPERLETYIEHQKTQLEDKSRIAKDVITQLKGIQRESGERPVARYYEGKDGTINAFRRMFDLRDSGNDIYMIYPLDLVEEKLTPEELEPRRKYRKEKNIISHALYTSTKKERLSDPQSERVKIDEKKYPVFSDITVLDNNVLISVLGKRIFGILIESKEIAETIKSLIKIGIDKK